MGTRILDQNTDIGGRILAYSSLAETVHPTESSQVRLKGSIANRKLKTRKSGGEAEDKSSTKPGVDGIDNGSTTIASASKGKIPGKKREGERIRGRQKKAENET